jgi:hypothetical protein
LFPEILRPGLLGATSTPNLNYIDVTDGSRPRGVGTSAPKKFTASAPTVARPLSASPAAIPLNINSGPPLPSLITPGNYPSLRIEEAKPFSLYDLKRDEREDFFLHVIMNGKKHVSFFLISRKVFLFRVS